MNRSSWVGSHHYLWTHYRGRQRPEVALIAYHSATQPLRSRLLDTVAWIAMLVAIAVFLFVWGG